MEIGGEIDAVTLLAGLDPYDVFKSIGAPTLRIKRAVDVDDFVIGGKREPFFGVQGKRDDKHLEELADLRLLGRGKLL